MMDMGFHRRGVGAQLASGGHGLLAGALHHPRMDLRGPLRAKEPKGAGKAAEGGNRVLVKAGKPAVEQAGAQLPLELPERPPFEVLEPHATPEPVRGEAGAPKAGGARAAPGEEAGAEGDQ